MPRFAPIPRGDVEVFGPGEEIADPDPADFILTHRLGWQSSMIRVCQRLRMRAGHRAFAYWSHAAIFVDSKGGIVEAEIGGVQHNHISRYRENEYHVVRLGSSANSPDREQAARFALECVGEPYGYLTAFSVGVSLLTGSRFSFGFDAHQICSGLVARALERTWAVFDREPSHVMPADLARHYDVRPPAKRISA